MKRIFKTIFVFASMFFFQSKVVAKNDNALVEKANFIKQKILLQYKTENQNRLIAYIHEHHDLDKIESENLKQPVDGNWFNWYNWDNWNTWYTWDNWNTWFTWNTWNTWSTWDNWGNWFNWTNY